MRRRLLISMIAVAVVAVLALGIPLAIVLGRLQADEAGHLLQGNARDIGPGGSPPACRPATGCMPRSRPGRWPAGT
jgi:hypothetical protein